MNTTNHIPTGLTMAVELQRRGVPFRIIDKTTKPVPTSNALAAQTRTVEIWKEQGLLADAISRGNKIVGLNVYTQERKLARLDFANLSSNEKYILAIAQHQTEAMMIEYLQKQQINVEMNVELTDLHELAAGVNVSLRHADGKTENLATDWLIACDGGHSVVRTQANIEFEGKELPQHFVLADIKAKTDLAADEFYIFLSKQGLLLFVSYDNEQSRIIAEVTHDPDLSGATSLTYEQVQRLAEKRCPFKLEFPEPIWTSGFWIHEHMANEFRRNRIFLAGDAAHIHSPAGGQGMNTGIQDAYNLAWKLALVIQQKAHPVILDSYFQERAPVAKAILRNTTLLTRMMTSRNALLCAVRNFVLWQAAKISKITKKIEDNVTELAIHYSSNLLVKDCLGNQAGPKAGTLLSSNLMDATHGTEYYLLRVKIPNQPT